MRGKYTDAPSDRYRRQRAIKAVIPDPVCFERGLLWSRAPVAMRPRLKRIRQRCHGGT
jgi:hypothetical protein